MQGAYALIVKNREKTQLVIGSLQEKTFKEGVYVYVGSAFGENKTIENRVNRHIELSFSRKGKVHWHIDYLLSSSDFELIGYNVFPSKNRNECEVADEIRKVSKEEVERFGCSDCNCKSHLFYQGKI